MDNETKEEKDREVEQQLKDKVKIGPKNPIWKTLMNICVGIVVFGGLFLFLLVYGYKFFSHSGFGGLLERLSQSISNESKTVSMVTFMVLILIAIAIKIFKLTPPKFDGWIKDIAVKTISCSYIFYDRKYLYMEYDIKLYPKDIKEFVKEITDKSNYFSYFVKKIDIDNYVVQIEIKDKEPLPNKSSLDKKTDTVWNFIPLGDAINDKTMKVSKIGWYLNDNIKDETAIELTPSNSMVIAGGTGSGKSVTENGIIGHITRHSDNIQGLLVDVKKVEFGGLENFKGIKKVGLTVSECDEILRQAKDIMMNRFEFMEKQNVNNIYKVGTIVDYYEINGKKFQWDEIFTCVIDGDMKLLTLNQIYDAVQNGSDVEIKDCDAS